MHPNQYIAERQYSWARRHGITIDEAGFTDVLNDNLFLPLTAEAIQEFQAGAGGELENNMLAAHSSSAIVANVFNYWRLYNNLVPIISVICPNLGNYTNPDIRFEVQCPINWPVQPPVPVRPPHLDVVIRFQDPAEPEVTKAIAIESKFGEPYAGGMLQGEFADRYVAQENALMWDGFEPLREVAIRINGGEVLFHRLHVAQLIKHILGLKSGYQGTKNFELLYLWYPAPGHEACEHEEEIGQFEHMINVCMSPVKFRATKYPDLTHALATRYGDTHGAYVDYLMERYF
jgi:hypothetical protein